MIDLSYQDGERTLIVESLVKAVAGSGRSYGPDIRQIPFRHQGKSFQITEVVKAAAGNRRDGHHIMKPLFEHQWKSLSA